MAPRVEKRTDPDDGKKYSRDDFVEYYGEKKGGKRWDKAEEVPAPKAKAKAKAKVKAKAKAKEADRGPRKPRVDDDLVEAALKEAMGSPAKTVELIAPIEEGMPGPEHFKISEAPVGEVEDGGILLQVLYISPDPYMRGQMKKQAAGSAVRGFVCGRVLASKSSKWHPGDFLGTSTHFTTVQVLSEKHLASVTRLTGLIDETTASRGVGILGMPGATAYAGFTEILRPKRPKNKGEGNGEVLFVSAASGAVGQIVGQLGKLAGCTVIGSAGGADKCATLKEKFGYDHTIDYKSCADATALKAKLKECSEDGIDMYFENVGGMHFQASFESLKPHGRIAVCGQISGYNDKVREPTSINLGAMIYPSLRIEGFVSGPRLNGDGKWLRENARNLKKGDIKITETETVGIENFGASFQSLFNGTNNGKVVVKVADVKPLRAPKAEVPKAEAE